MPGSSETSRIRSLVIGSSGALAVACVSICAGAMSLIGPREPHASPFPEDGEYGYPTGFFLAAATTGVTAMASYGDRGRARVMGLWLVTMLGGWVVFLRWMIVRNHTRRGAWIVQWIWDRAVRGLEVVFVEGLVIGLAVAASVVLIARMTSCRLDWKLGLCVAIGLGLGGNWLVPWASGAITDFLLQSRWDDRVLGSSKALRDAAAGGCIGALVGAVVTVMAARSAENALGGPLDLRSNDLNVTSKNGLER